MTKHVHFIGIGGIGMSGIAQLLLNQGMKVSGSDLKESSITADLKRLGAEIFIGHNSVNIQGADLVVYSSAIKAENPELNQAKKQGIPLMKRAQALAYLMQEHKETTVITVTGSHGKTTTASLVSCLLLEAGLCPTVALGGILRNIDTNACLGSGRFFVAEADESDGSFLYYRPQYSIITNIDYEHLDYYKEFKNVLQAFREFVDRTEKNGCVFACGDDLNLMRILKESKNRYVFFGENEKADVYPKNIQIKGLTSEFDGFYKDEFIGRFYLPLGGRHNISNSLAVIALAFEMRIELEVLKKALAGYKGAQRRLEVKFQGKDYVFVDDYAHHPTEIMATLQAVRNLSFQRLIAIFQPHRYTRTKLLWKEFSRCFDLADYVIITDIYPANEEPLANVTGEGLCAGIKEHSPNKPVYFLPKEEILPHILKNLKAGDLIITLGAGDIVKICDELVAAVKR